MRSTRPDIGAVSSWFLNTFGFWFRLTDPDPLCCVRGALQVVGSREKRGGQGIIDRKCLWHSGSWEDGSAHGGVGLVFYFFFQGNLPCQVLPGGLPSFLRLFLVLF